MSENNEGTEVVVRRIVVPMADVMRLALQWFVAMLVVGVLLFLLGAISVAVTGYGLMELVLRS